LFAVSLPSTDDEAEPLFKTSPQFALIEAESRRLGEGRVEDTAASGFLFVGEKSLEIFGNETPFPDSSRNESLLLEVPISPRDRIRIDQEFFG
jgi:hypothetical protein